ncbi:hypothetical protein C0583_02515 [Candidatus Parcubacteria bacterium]|nr:MAG: hypothetical protein C0583_02515 [Candidatus Parcubacteria bacterium]
MLKKYLILSVLILILLLLIGWQYISIKGIDLTCTECKQGDLDIEINDFDTCVQEGNPVMESYPRQCRSGDQLFVEEVDLGPIEISEVVLDLPRPNQVITSPLKIVGEAKGTWFFEATMPVVLTDWDGLIIAEGYVTAYGDWMTEEMVAFKGTLEFEKPDYKNNGSLIIQKSNPSGLAKNDDAYEIQVLFE